MQQHQLFLLAPITENTLLMKCTSLAILTLLIFATAAKAQKTEFPPQSNTFVIVDDSLKMSDFANLFFRNGYLFTHKDSSIIITDFKYLGRIQLTSFLCNKIDSAFYIRGTYKHYDSDKGEVTEQVRYGPGYKRLFEDMYDILNSIKPNLVIKAVEL